MIFVQLLKSLDEILFELMSWFVFFPLTLRRVIRHPLTMMRYAEEQLRLPAGEEQYRTTVSPPVMLILTIVISQAIGLAVLGSNPIVRSNQGLAALVSDNTTLLLLRLVLFAIFAVVLATRKVRRSSVELERATLKPAFYAQCYAISPVALLSNVGITAFGHHHPALQVAGTLALVVAIVFYGAVQFRWFRQELGGSVARSAIDALIGIGESFALFVLLALPFV
ncbi:hypothetical protein [Sphingomonas montana]|uniref:hypothetical protein n=1 Tax=Sphingomonas montana TaxID=1843236 RepID=UPI00096C61D4|nr:hypothetical protein [Sphingomonas montana]